ncbi:hypothetical protein BH23PLA1_BH23PLA1_24910 [soil metagenome]
MADTTENLPKFSNPPLVETVLGVQFASIPGFTSGHCGWYWKKYLDSSWVKTSELPALPDQFEKFGHQDWRPPSIKLTASLAPHPSRLQIINSDDDQVIQIQKNRFIYNWRKRDSVYPSFDKLFPDFLSKFSGFRDFLEAAGLGTPSPNQWEVSYVNHIPKGSLWETPGDWHLVLPGLYPLPLSLDDAKFESMTSEVHYEIIPKRGRLHISVHHGKVYDDNKNDREIIVLHLTARGPVLSDKSGWDTDMKIGHQVLVRTFARIASQRALEYWGVA